MKSKQQSVFTLALALALAVSAHAAGRGTDILHLDINTAMTNNGVETGVTGRVKLHQNQQGKANNQQLDIAIRGLATNTTYQLVAAIDDDTNYMQITDFTADAKGNALLRYKNNGKNNGKGKNPKSLPTALNPVSLIREVDIFNASTQAVLTADLSRPDRLQYLIKRDLSTNDVTSSLRIKATVRKTQFRLLSAGLAANSDYLLVYSGVVAGTNQSNASGKLDIKELIDGPTDILDLRSVELWDASSNVVLQTELP